MRTQAPKCILSSRFQSSVRGISKELFTSRVKLDIPTSPLGPYVGGGVTDVGGDVIRGLGDAMRGHHRVWLAVGSTLSGVILVGLAAGPAAASTSTLVNESFTGTSTSSSQWVLPATPGTTNQACLTNGNGTGPVGGCATSGLAAGLQLTPDDYSQEGGVVYGSSVPSSLGLDVTFDSYQYSASTDVNASDSGADGISFFLAASSPTNASASPITLGPFGGHLGYSEDTASSTPGLTNGYLGFGLDAYGNFSNADEADPNCFEEQGFTPQAVAVRGPGNGTSGYCLLSSTQLGSTQSLNTQDTTQPQAVPVEIAVNPTGEDQTDEAGDNVPAGTYRFVVSPIGGGSIVQTGALPPDTGYNLPAGWLDGNGVPDQLTFGWAASTGAAKDYHTISNVNVQTLNGTPPTLAVHLTDTSGGTAQSGDTVYYDATVSVSGSDETRPITLTDTFPAGLTPQTPLVDGDWVCQVNGQTVTCTDTHSLSTIQIPVTVSVPPGPPVVLTDTATAGAIDATQGSDTDTQTYYPAPVAPTATVLGFTTQPVDAQVNATMKNADNSTTHIQVAADVTSGGAVDTTYTGNVTLGFGTNPSGAQFVVGGTPASSITVAAVNGVADFSPIIVNAVGFNYTLQATAAGLTSATSNSFNIAAAATSCPAGKTCTVTTTSPSTGISALISAGSGSGNSIVTATFGGNVAPIHPCTGVTAGILTFSGNRQKTITLTIPIKQGSLLFCYGQPTPFLDIFWHKTTYFSTVNHEYEGLLPLCFKNYTGPCVKSIAFTKTTEKVIILSGTADPRIMR
jgi:hypothetical protein